MEFLGISLPIRKRSIKCCLVQVNILPLESGDKLGVRKLRSNRTDLPLNRRDGIQPEYKIYFK